MPEPRNPQQATADAVVRAVKERRQLVRVAELGLRSPQEMSAQDIESVCRFVVDHADCLELSKTR